MTPTGSDTHAKQQDKAMSEEKQAKEPSPKKKIEKKPTKDLTKRKYSKISQESHDLLGEYFSSASQGAGYLADAFPMLFRAILKQVKQQIGTIAVMSTAKELATRIMQSNQAIAWNGEDALSCAPAKVQPALREMGWMGAVMIEMEAIKILSESLQAIRNHDQRKAKIAAIFDAGVEDAENRWSFVALRPTEAAWGFYEDHFPKGSIGLAFVINKLPNWMKKIHEDYAQVPGLPELLKNSLELCPLDSPVAAGSFLWPAVQQHVRLVGVPDGWPQIQRRLVTSNILERFVLEAVYSASGQLQHREAKLAITVVKEFENHYLEWEPVKHAGLVFSYTSFLPVIKATLADEVAGNLSTLQLEVMFRALKALGVGSGLLFGRSLIPAIEEYLDLRPDLVDNRVKFLEGFEKLPLFARGALEFLGAHVENTPKQKSDWIRLLARGE
ncbi:hypothetical protein [Geoalkalibacter halelectricus]|uniref:hypothetical protein n=1 Tax=Geoalkalibacter halelectricus TaxID=2847045 RepID=UPI003D204EB5